MRAVGPSRAEVRAATERVFQRPEFSEHKSVIVRIIEWILHKLGLDRSSTVGSVGPPATSSGLGSLLVYLVVIVVVGLIAYAAWYAWNHRTPRVAKDKAKPSVEVEERRTTSQWGREAERAEAREDWKEAVRCRYRELVGVLVDRGALPGIPGRTTGELRGDLAEAVPAATADFDQATRLFELPWYADVPTGPAENARFRELAGAIVAVLPRAVDRPAVGDAPLEVRVVDGEPVEVG